LRECVFLKTKESHHDLLHPPLERVQALHQGRVRIDDALEKNQAIADLGLQKGLAGSDDKMD
jgi:hypothetical protein